MSKGLGSVEKALDILCLFDFDNPKLSAQEISDRLDIPLSSVYKYLDVLLRKGFITKNDNSKQFILGLSIFHLLNVCIVGKKLIDVALPEMEFLWKETGETILLSVAHGQEVMCLERILSNKLIKLSLERGEIKPMYAGADGKVVLAYQNQSFIEKFCNSVKIKKYTKNTPKNHSQLLEQLQQILRQGYSITDSEVDEGAIAVAAPIFNHKKKLIAAITIAGLKERTPFNVISRWSELIVEKAISISSELGFSGKIPKN